MFNKRKVTSVKAHAFVGEKNEGTQISERQFGEFAGSKLTITGFLIDENDTVSTERAQIVMRNSEVGAIKAALLNELKRGKGVLEGELTNLRTEDGDITYPLPRVDLKLSEADGSKAFTFTPEATPKWVDTKAFGEVAVSAVNYGTTKEQQDAFRELRKNGGKRA